MMRLGRLFGGFGVVLALASGDGNLAQAQDVRVPVAEQEQSRLHVLYDPTERSATRRMVSVLDPHPELNLHFTWSPAPGNWPGIDEETGRATGEGHVAWRVQGAARYDPRSIHHSYEGGLRDGRFHGHGVLRYRDGTVIDGIWSDGALEGEGSLRDAQGNRYEGAFRNGKAEGTGTWFARAGWVYHGGFAAGVPHGAGEIRHPGGQAYAVAHDAGRLVASERPDILPDPLVGGVLPAQSGGMAARTELAIIVDPRIAFEQADSLPYTHWTDAETTTIYPDNPDMIDLWNGDARIDWLFYMFDEEVLWDESYAAVRAEMRTTDGSRVELRELALEFAESEPYLKPMLRRREHLGCLPFRPSFTLENLGWGPVENPVLEIGFAHPERQWSETFYESGQPIPVSEMQSLPIAGFDLGTDVELRTVLAALGVDIRALERPFFDCSAFETAERCLPHLLETIDFGELAPHIGASVVEFNTNDPANAGAWRPDGAFQFQTLATGTLRYDWTDNNGATIRAEEPFDAMISLMVAERRELSMAEAGAGGAFAVAAPDFMDVGLPTRGRRETVSIVPVGNPMVSAFSGRYRMHAQRNSIHRFEAVARFADGSERRSLPATLFYMMPRLEGYATRVTPAKCTMPPVFNPIEGGNAG